MSECKTGKRNSQLEHGEPMEQTRGLFCKCDSGVARCQTQHQCHFWRMSQMFEENYFLGFTIARNLENFSFHFVKKKWPPIAEKKEQCLFFSSLLPAWCSGYVARLVPRGPEFDPRLHQSVR